MASATKFSEIFLQVEVGGYFSGFIWRLDHSLKRRDRCHSTKAVLSTTSCTRLAFIPKALILIEPASNVAIIFGDALLASDLFFYYIVWQVHP